MKVEILDEAQQDLIEGFHFYERQAQDVGDYFLDSLFSDVDSLQIYSVPESCPFARVGGYPKRTRIDDSWTRDDGPFELNCSSTRAESAEVVSRWLPAFMFN